MDSNFIFIFFLIISGVMQATSTGGTKLDKRYSPSFRDDTSRKQSTTKRKRDDVSVLRLVPFF